MSGGTPTISELMHMVIEVQLYLADRYNLSAADSATVFAGALADTVAYGLQADVSARAVDEAIQNATREMKTLVRFRLENPPAMTLREIIAEYRQTGGKVRVS